MSRSMRVSQEASSIWVGEAGPTRKGETTGDLTPPPLTVAAVSMTRDDNSDDDYCQRAESGNAALSYPPRRNAFFQRLTQMTAETAPKSYKIFFACAYGVSSVVIMMVVKVVMTEYGFASFLCVAMLQYLCSSLVQLLQRNVLHTVAPFPLDSAWRTMLVTLFPLPMLFVANTLSGLGASRDLSMPVFVMMRRISIAMTMVLEWLILHKRPSSLVVISVCLMIFAATVGTHFRFSGSLKGMAMVHLNNLLTALQGVFLRKKTDEAKHVLTSDGVLFYNNLFAFLVVAVLVVTNVSGDRDVVLQYSDWSNPGFLVMLFCSSIMGFMLSYSTMMCTKLNSPLSTAMVGAAKNTITSYAGMVFSDYVFDWWNFVGVNIGVVGALIFGKAELDKKLQSSAASAAEKEKEKATAGRGKGELV